jgi:hypothetical protein
MGIPTSQNPNTPEGLESRLSVEHEQILAELLHSSYEEGSRRAEKPSGPQSLAILPTRLHLATTLRMRYFLVESPKFHVCILISTVGGYLWGHGGAPPTWRSRFGANCWPAGQATWPVGQPGGAASIDFIHCLGLLLLM